MFQPILHSLNIQENASVVNKKPIILNSNSLTPRKAFQDRDVNKKLLENSPLKPQNKLHDEIKMQQKSPSKIDIDWMNNYCSYKPVEDTYEEILPSKDRSSRNKFTERLYSSAKIETPERKIYEFHFKEILDLMVFPYPTETELVEEDEDIFPNDLSYNEYDY